jgi:hypothetical protein
LRGASGEVLIGGVACIEAIAAVGVEGQAGGSGCIERVAQHSAVIDVAIVDGDTADENGAVLGGVVCIRHRDRGIVRSGDGDD